MSAPVDIAIVGGGLVGASLACALAASGRSVTLIEAAAPPAGEPSWDERCIALNAASVRILKSLQVWDALQAAAEPIRSTHISEQGRFGVARFTAEEAGLDALGYNIPVRQLGRVLWQHAGQTSAQLRCPAKLQAMESVEGGWRLTLDHQPAVQARLVVAADGAHSRVRELMGVTAQTRDYQQCAIVTALRVSRPHAGCAYERFTPEGPIALLPKPGQDCSLVWTVPQSVVSERMAQDDAEFMQAAQAAFGERLGRFTALGHRVAYPLTRVLSEELTRPRLLFIGNAAQSLHPVAAQGFNLGLRDVAALQESLATASDPGAADLVARYAASRLKDRQVVSDFTDQLVRLFSNRQPGLSQTRHLGILALDLIPAIKQRVLWQNLGYRHAPRVVRAVS